VSQRWSKQAGLGEAAGFADVSIQPTQVIRRPNLLALADQIDPALVPANLDNVATVSALDGLFASSHQGEQAGLSRRQPGVRCSPTKSMPARSSDRAGIWLQWGSTVSRGAR
jgi:hypothetical protein